MTRSIKPGQWCASALLLLACANGFASDVQNNLYLTAQYSGGTLDTDIAEIDTEEYHIGAGLILSENLQVEGGYSSVDFEGVESDLLRGALLYVHALQSDFSIYGKAGLNYWDSSDADETETGYSAGFGLLWGSGKIDVIVGVEYMDNIENDAVFDDITIYTLGMRYYLGDTASRKNAAAREGNTSLEATTACKEKHRDMFMMCPEKE